MSNYKVGTVYKNTRIKSKLIRRIPCNWKNKESISCKSCKGALQFEDDSENNYCGYHNNTALPLFFE